MCASRAHAPTEVCAAPQDRCGEGEAGPDEFVRQLPTRSVVDLSTTRDPGVVLYCAAEICDVDVVR